MHPDADVEWPRAVCQTMLVNLSQDLPRRLNRVTGGGGIVERRTILPKIRRPEIY